MQINFSIIIPSFNSAQFISKCIDSVIKQTYKNWEIIVIDNNSKDETVKIINSFKSDKIKIYKINNEGIIAKSRNLGIMNSTGNWIAFLDSDDSWEKNKLDICLKYIEKKNIDFIYHDLNINYQNKKKFFSETMKGYYLKKPIIKDLLKKGNSTPTSSIVVKKELIIKVGLLDESKNIAMSEDYNLTLKIASITDRFKYINKKLGTYLIHKENSSKKNYDASNNAKHSIKKFLKYLNNKEIKWIKINLFYLKAKYYYNNKKFNIANKFLKICLINGNIKVKFKSLIFIFIIFFKSKMI